MVSETWQGSRMDDWVPRAGPSPDDRHASVNMSARMTKTSGARASSRQPKRLTPCRNRRHINDNPALRSDGDAVDGLAAGAIDGGEAQVLQQGGEGGGLIPPTVDRLPSAPAIGRSGTRGSPRAAPWRRGRGG
jgi:hypothetical protein